MADTNHPDNFPELRFHTFESYAHKWAESSYWPFIKRIVLYRTPVATYDFKKKYLLFFELSQTTDRGDKGFIQLLKGPDWLVWLGESENKFREIYKKEPGENYIDEWVVETEKPKGIVDKHSWILFSRSDKEKTVQEKTIGQDHEDFIKNLRVSFENDNEIKIQLPSRKANCFTCESLGFRDKETKSWKDLIEILQNPPHTYYLGPAYKYISVYNDSDKIQNEEAKPKYSKKGERHREYDKRYKRLGEINKKLITYFNEHCPIQIPSDYKLYELFSDKEPGTYRFKFEIMSDKKESKKDQVLNKFEKLTNRYRETQNDSYLERINDLAATIIENKWLTNDEIENAIRSDQLYYQDIENGCSQKKKLPTAK